MSTSDNVLIKNRALTGVFVISVVLAAVIAVSTNNKFGGTNGFLMIVVGAIALIAILAVIALAFSLAGMADSRSALGLPEGSIRAVMAMGLFVAFVGTAGFLYNGLAQTGLYKVASVDATEPELVGYAKNFVVIRHEPTKDAHFSADLMAKPDLQAAGDLAKQIFTTVATALVTVIGFYFGSGSLTSAVSAVRAASAPNAPLPDSDRANSIDAQAKQLAQDVDAARKAMTDAAVDGQKAADRASAQLKASDTFSAQLNQVQASRAQADKLAAAVTESLTAVATQIALIRKPDTPPAARTNGLQAAETALAAARTSFDQLSSLRTDVEQAARSLAAAAPPSPETPGDGDGTSPPAPGASPAGHGPDGS